MSDSEFDLDYIVSDYALHVGPHIYTDWRFFCLGHNFDVVGAILSMADLSWQKGWEARETVYEFCAATDSEDAKRYARTIDIEPIQFR